MKVRPPPPLVSRRPKLRIWWCSDSDWLVLALATRISLWYASVMCTWTIWQRRVSSQKPNRPEPCRREDRSWRQLFELLSARFAADIGFVAYFCARKQQLYFQSSTPFLLWFQSRHQVSDSQVCEDTLCRTDNSQAGDLLHFFKCFRLKFFAIMLNKFLLQGMLSVVFHA